MRPRFPRWLAGTPLGRYVLHFEAALDRAVAGFADGLAPGSRVLDAGAGEGRYARNFARHRYVGVDLAVGDAAWDYSRLEAVADLNALPFAPASFDACISIVTLEHLAEPGRALREIGRVLRAGGSLLVAAPHEWEVHQAPHDYFRFTRYGIRHLLEQAGFGDIIIEPVGGYFRLVSRRLLNGLQFFPALLQPLAALLVGPPALALPLLDSLDRERNFTLGYLCTARKSS